MAVKVKSTGTLGPRVKGGKGTPYEKGGIIKPVKKSK